MNRIDEINTITIWFKNLHIEPFFVPFILGFLASIFQVLAWYAHTKLSDSYSMIQIILISWLFAFFEFIFLIPAINIANYDKREQKLDLVMFTVYNIVCFFFVFSLFNSLVLKNSFHCKYLVAFFLMSLSVWIIS